MIIVVYFIYFLLLNPAFDNPQKNKNPPRWRRVALYFYEFVYTLAPPPCSAGTIMTTTITTSMAAILVILLLLINIKIECTVNVHQHFEINKELF